MRARALTLSQAVLPGAVPLHQVLLLVGFSWLVAAAARVSIPLPWSEVPVTGQTFAVLLTGAALGSRRGALSLLLYLAQGAAGLPVFAFVARYGGYGGGIARLLGPTGGYLAGFVVAAFVVGWLAERGWDRRLLTAALAMAVGNAIVYLFGLPWLARFVPADRLLISGLIPFIPGDLTKLILAALALPAAWRLVPRK